ncbi:hypothetical protein B5807_00714 [Epicoccum nigrum]|uniref:Uncharacterized protein n=1 Tax=Epicoccum nigrum TaxID=105696 RepID=A0A1Y2MES7_EPING|nr:hypothetical protein B5807_00714 [Epicoccum nigrum]
MPYKAMLTEPPPLQTPNHPLSTKSVELTHTTRLAPPTFRFSTTLFAFNASRLLFFHARLISPLFSQNHLRNSLSPSPSPSASLSPPAMPTSSSAPSTSGAPALARVLALVSSTPPSLSSSPSSWSASWLPLRQSKLNRRPMAAVSGVGAALRRPRHSRSRCVKGVAGSVDSCSVEGAGGEVASLSKKEKDVLIGGGLVGVVSVGAGARLKRASRGWTSFEPSFGSVAHADVVVNGVGLEAALVLALVTAGKALAAFLFSSAASDSDSDSSSVSAASESESSSSDELDTTLESSSSSELSDSGGGGAFFFSFLADAAAGFFTMGRPCESVGGGSLSGCPSTSCSTRLCAAFLVSGSTTVPSSSTQPTPSM